MNVISNYELVNSPTIDWADYEENDPQVKALSDIGKNVLSALIILMYQNKQHFGTITTLNHADIKNLSFCERLRDVDITRAFNRLLKNRIVVAVTYGKKQLFTVPRFFRRFAV